MTRWGRGSGLAIAAATMSLLAAACSGGSPSLATRAEALATVTTTSTIPAPASTSSSTTSTSTSVVPTTSTTPPPPPPGLGKGSRGPEVLALEQHLDALHYDVGTVDDVFDDATAFAVTAFQKVIGAERTGRATDDVVAAVAAAKPPPALVPGGGANRVEIDIPRQVLFLYEGGRLTKILPVSSGSNQRFCSEGWCRKAVTPGGAFAVYRQAKGWEHGPLGDLYNPQYFNDGIAIHGSPSVPPYPASHGCIRIPMSAAEWFPSHVYVGMPVYVTGAPEALDPALLQAPTTTTAPAPTTTTSTTTPQLLGGLLKPR